MVTVAIGAHYDVLVAQDGLAGWKAFLENKDEIALILSDIMMPVMGGVEMAERILAEGPDTRILLMTAYNEDVVRPFNLRGLPIIRKPFLADELLRRIGEALDDAATA